MNRERAETYLRLLAEAELRDLRLQSNHPSPPLALLSARLARVAWALTVVGALEGEIADELLHDVDLAVAVRTQAGARTLSQARLGLGGRVGRPFQFASAALMAGLGPVPPPGPGPDAAERYLPLGRTLLFRDETTRGELNLISFAQTGAGTRLVATWRTQDLLGRREFGLPPLEQFTVADDRGTRYRLEFNGAGRPDSVCDLWLRPDPPAGVQWIDISTPSQPAVMIMLGPAPEGEGVAGAVGGDEAVAGAEAVGGAGGAAGAGTVGTAVADSGAGVAAGAGAGAGAEADLTVREAERSAGEQLLLLIADRLLAMAADLSGNLRPQAGLSSGLYASRLAPVSDSLGSVVAALEAADALSPLSPVPGQLATVCASLGLTGHEITVPPALHLPERWVSLLAQLHRRKPETTSISHVYNPHRYPGYVSRGLAPHGLAPHGLAPLAAALPDMDGIRLVLLGVHADDEGTWLVGTAQGKQPDIPVDGLLLERSFPLSLWVRDPGGHWHLGALHGRSFDNGEAPVTFRLLPPLGGPVPWVDVLVAGRSAEVHGCLTLHWSAGGRS